MFRLFCKPKKAKCPIKEDSRLWMEDTFLWLLSEFGEEKIKTRKVLCPTQEDFPIAFEQSEKDAQELLAIVAKQMEVDVNTIDLKFYDQKLIEFSGDLGHRIFSQQATDQKYSSGQYSGKNKSGKYQIALESAQLKDTEALVATIAHEISHIKLLGEARLKQNDEHLTDLIPIIYGLGIFNANSAFRFFTTPDSWGYSRQGYLNQQEWGYALALFSYVRRDKNPKWITYLTPNVKSDFKKSEKFICDNTDIIFRK